MVTGTEIGAAATVLNQARGLLKQLQQSKLSSQHEALVREAMDVVSDATERLLGIHSGLLELQQENAALKAMIEKARSWETRLAQYPLVKAPGGGLILQSKQPIDHFACPTCAETDKEIHVLQPGSDWGGDYHCRKCDASYSVAVPKPMPHAGSGGWT
jgi:predicted RNA-binding Zn-ribbon protein involved in translation (DUF1610 family)